MQFPQYFTKLSQTLSEIKKEIDPNFRLFLDFQGFTQNEIPDSLIAEESVVMHIDEDNVDAMPSFGDIWTKILDQNYLEVLTNQQPGQQAIRNIDYLSNNEWSTSEGLRAKNMKYMFEKSVNNDTMTASFRDYLRTQRETFEGQLNEQKAQTKREMEEARQRALEEEEARIQAQKLLEMENKLEQVQEEDDDAAFSNASDLKDYDNLKEGGTEHTGSVKRLALDETFKYDKNSDQQTMR